MSIALDSSAQKTVPPRSEVPVGETWNLESVFPTVAAWEAALAAVDARLSEFDRYRGRVGESAGSLLAVLKLHDELYEQVEKVQVFAMLRRSEDTTNATATAMDSRGQGLLARFEEAAAFVPVEILEIPAERISAWIEEESGLAIYRHLL